jgi:hypothetical protein
MPPRPTFTTALARLVPGGSAAGGVRCYRPLVAGPAILRRPRGAAAWTVDLACDRLLRPRAPSGAESVVRLVRSLAARGVACRVGAALAGPLDAPVTVGGTRLGRVAEPSRRRIRLDIYGWALMYQPPGMRGRAVVDADDRFADLPAVFELPLELLDRAEFLEARGFRTRPLVIPTAADDFAAGIDGRPRNRFFPDADFRPPADLDRLL